MMAMFDELPLSPDLAHASLINSTSTIGSFAAALKRPIGGVVEPRSSLPAGTGTKKKGACPTVTRGKGNEVFSTKNVNNRTTGVGLGRPL